MKYGKEKLTLNVSIIAIDDLFQLQSVTDNCEYGSLAPNVWQEHFKMFELQGMRQQESKAFAEILNKLRERKYTKEDFLKSKERTIQPNSINFPIAAPHWFVQNSKVERFNDRAHCAISGTMYTIKANDSVIGAESR